MEAESGESWNHMTDALITPMRREADQTVSLSPQSTRRPNTEISVSMKRKMT